MRDELRSCTHKNQYTRTEALDVIKQVRKRGERTGNLKHHLSAYKCGFCGNWHIGHSSPPARRNYKRVKQIHYDEDFTSRPLKKSSAS